MPIGRGLSGSQTYRVQALSPVALATPGSTTPVNYGEFGWGTLIAIANSAAYRINVERSATSNGTFAQIGCSLTTTASEASQRSFTMESSAIWYRVSYDNNDQGSVIAAI